MELILSERWKILSRIGFGIKIRGLVLEILNLRLNLRCMLNIELVVEYIKLVFGMGIWDRDMNWGVISFK